MNKYTTRGILFSYLYIAKGLSEHLTEEVVNMGWNIQSGWRLLEHDSLSRKGVEQYKINNSCFIRREHQCGKIFGASKSCFIASPDDDNLEPILELMSEKLVKDGIEPIIAVKERAYGQDIFCIKICGKIIESRFSIVILDDTVKEDTNIPNPNVYYEYGLMTSMGKHVIPLQKDDLILAFNIQSHDTIKYNSKNIGTELNRAIKDAILVSETSEDENKQVGVLSDKSILHSYEKAGFEKRPHEWVLYPAISDTDFIGFGQYTNRYYLFLGKIDNETEIQTYLEDLSIVLYRTKKIYERLQKEQEQLREKKTDLETKLGEEPKKGKPVPSLRIMQHSLPEEIDTLSKRIGSNDDKITLIDKLYVCFVINCEMDVSHFKSAAESIAQEYENVSIVVSNNNKVEIGDIEINLKIIENSS